MFGTLFTHCVGRILIERWDASDTFLVVNVMFIKLADLHSIETVQSDVVWLITVLVRFCFVLNTKMFQI